MITRFLTEIRGSKGLFAILLTLSLLIWWRTLLATVSLAATNEAHTHILMVIPLSLALTYMWRETLPTPTSQSGALGSVLLALALLMSAFANLNRALPEGFGLSVIMLALVMWWWGCVVMCFGIRTFQSLLFPLCFLLWMVPIPKLPLNWITEWLQLESATTARILFRLLGVPVTQDGIMLSIPGLEIEVASQCSSIRSSLFLLMTTMVLAELLLHDWWRRVVLIGAAIPLAFLKNGFRIFVIAELATHVDGAYLDGWLHHQGGIVFFGMALTAQAMLLWGLRRLETPSELATSITPH